MSKDDDPWGFLVFKVANNRLFAWMQEEEKGSVSVTLKMEEGMRLIALNSPHVSLASHLGRYGWLQPLVSDEDTFQEVLGWLEESWWLRAPKRLRRALEDSDHELS